MRNEETFLYNIYQHVTGACNTIFYKEMTIIN